ncbi:hypothetical protein L484_006044 [Morus notabilis]|uniref:DUF674 family protein n=1 Tax=Morus notabilis TaxID=981085 RepID=W9QP60_9ROSA|nr:hypothetical protein L484_006044 [Morus notabilis]
MNLSRAASEDGNCFVKGGTAYMIYDDLQVVPVSSSQILSLFSEIGVKDQNSIDELTINVLNLLFCSLVSKAPLTETFLNSKTTPESITATSFHKNSSVKEEKMTNDQEEKIDVKLIVSRSKKKVCYAEASFYNMKQVHDGSLKGCIDHLYKSVLDLDEQHFFSNIHKKILVSPCPALGSRYTSDWFNLRVLAGTERPSPFATSLSVLHPLSRYDGGFLREPTLFIVTDGLTITPISSIVCFSILEESKVPFNGIQEKAVHVGKEEALRLLVSSFVSESALTNTFIRSQSRSNE